MGGRGSSSGGGRGSYSGELALPDGSKIEFDGTLRTGKKDAALSQTQRKAVEDWESKRVKNKVEYAFSVDADGNPVGKEVRGRKDSVRVPRTYHDTDDAVFTHIHPRQDGILGGTFSQADLNNFANYKNKTVRAAAKEGTYSISKSANFDKSGFKAFVEQAEREFDAELGRKSRTRTQAIKEGNLSWADYNKAYAKDFNTALVNLHNKYLSGQKTYGYTYTLEPR